MQTFHSFTACTRSLSLLLGRCDTEWLCLHLISASQSACDRRPVTNAIGTCTSQDMEIAVTKALEQSV